MTTLEGKRAFVTGGSRGIGAAIVKRLAAEGASVAFTYERSAELARAVAGEVERLGQRALPVQVDSADPQALKGAIDDAARALGGLDILVNNAGIARGGPIKDLTLQDIDAVLAVNVRAVVIASQAAAAHMQAGGRIISIGSNLGERAHFPGLSLYAMSKSALIGWTQGLARDLGPQGITVNLVQPGSTDTDMNPKDGANADHQRERMAIPKYGEPSDIAGLVAYLASEGAKFVTGARVTIDGGANA
jgi:3-oxoacyl-[acyl-carrier protein] reductase